MISPAFELRYVNEELQKAREAMERRERMRAEEALKASQEYARNIIDSSLDMIIAVDKDRKITEFNKAAQETFGYRAMEVLGKHVDILYADPEEGIQVHTTTLESGICIKEITNKRKNGEIFPCVLSASILHDAEGRIVGVMGVSRDITERKQMEEALRRSEENYQRTVTHLEDILYSVDAETYEFRYVNPAFEKLLGYTLEDVRQMGGRLAFMSQVWKEGEFTKSEHKRIYDQLRSHRMEEIQYRGETWVRCKDGSLKCLEDHWIPVYDGEHLISTDGVLRDITERKRAEEEYLRLATFPRENPNPILESDPAGNMIYINPAAERVLEALGLERITDLLPKNHAQLVRAILSEGESVQGIGVAVRDRIFSWSYHPVPDAGVVHLYGEDITDRQRSEEKVRESEKRFRELYDQAPVGYHEIDSEGRITRVNRTGLEMLGYTAEEMLGRYPWEFIVEKKTSTQAIHAKLKGMGEPAPPYERTWRKKDGTLLSALMQDYPLRDPSGRIVGIRATFQDISERKRQEQERIRLSRAVEQAAESIMITDPDGTLVYANPAFEKITGYSREETMGRNPRFLKSGKHDAAFYQGLWDALARGESWSGHFINKRKDETLFEEEAVISPIRDPDGRTVNYVAVKRDVTREVQLQEQLQQAQKMEAVGTLAGGVAHDFNNLLTIIIGFSELALYEDMSDRAKEYISRIPEQGKQAAELISQLLTFSRRAITRRREIQLVPLVKETVKLLERTVRETITIRWNSSDEVWLVNADPSQVQQVIMNLSVNANHAMPQGGELTINIENISLDEAYCKRYSYARPGDYVCLSVSDTGQGMTPETQEHIFEPFFTTKDVGKGTGLGLSMVYGIVKAHEGFIYVHSEEGVGSNFKVYLPVADSTVALGRGRG